MFLQSDKTSITYDYKLVDVDGVASLKEVRLYRNNALQAVSTDFNAKFTGLLSNTYYRVVYVVEKNFNDNSSNTTYTYEETIKTDTKDTSEVSMNFTAKADSIKIDFDLIDNDDTVSYQKIDVYQGLELVTTVTDFTEVVVENLLSNTLYEFILFYEVNLNDGTTPIVYSISQTYSTIAYDVEILSYEILNEFAPKTQEDINIKLTLDNKSNIKVDHLIVDGVNVDVTGGNLINEVIFIIRSNKISGPQEINIEKIIYQVNGIYVTQEVANEVSIEVEILSRLDIINIMPIDGGNIAKKDGNLNQGYVFTIDNPYGYMINSIEVNFNWNKTLYDVHMIDDNHFFVYTTEIDFESAEFTKINYTDNAGNHSVRDYIDTFYTNITFISPDEDYAFKMYPISTAEEFLNMESGKAYELVNDIDLSGYHWSMREFNGYFDGKGHTVSNLSFTYETEKTHIDNNAAVALYRNITGTFKNVYFENIYTSVEAKGHLSCRGLTIFNYATIENVFISGNFNINKNNEYGTNYDNSSSYSLIPVGQLKLNDTVVLENATITSDLFNSKEYRENTLGWIFNEKTYEVFGDYEYTIVDNAYIVINKYIGSDAHVIIPETINDLPVIAVGDLAFENNEILEVYEDNSNILWRGGSLFKNCTSFHTLNVQFVSNMSIIRTVIPETMHINMKSVSIEETKTDSIDSVLFGYMTNLEYVLLPKGISSINSIFNGISENNYTKFTQLKEVVLPDTLKYIGYDSFHSCTSLSIIDIPESVTYIEASAFAYCYGLTNVVLPDNITEIGHRAFFECKNLTEIKLPNNLKKLSSSVFNYCSNLQSIELPHGLEIMEDGVFQYCISLREVTLPNTLVKLGSSVFSNCKNLNTVVFSSGLTKIEDYTFSQCDNLIEIEIPESVETIGAHAFSNCDRLVEIEIPENVETIEYEAFYSCDNLVSVTLPSSMSTIENRAFMFCYTLQSIQIPKGALVGESAFEYCSSLSNIIISEGVSYIGENAFSDANYIDTLYIPESVATIGSGAFGSATNIYCAVESKPNGWADDWIDNQWNIIWDCGLMYIKDNILYSIKDNEATLFRIMDYFEELRLPRTITYNDIEYPLTRIANNSSSNWVHRLYIPDSILYIEDNAVTANQIFCEVEEKPDGWGNYWYDDFMSDAIFGFEEIIQTNEYEFILTSKGAIISSIYLSDNLTDIIIPSKVEYKEIEYDVTTIGSDAFYNSNITAVSIPNTVKTIQDRAFNYCTELTTITLSEGLESIGHYAFENCIKLDNVIIPNSVSTIGQYAFSFCSNLSNITLGTGISELSYGIFSYCSSLSSVELHNNITAIGESAFSECSSLDTILVPSSVQTIGSSAFSGCTSLESIIIPSSVQTIGSSAFSGCSNLVSVDLPEGLKTISWGMFYGCSNLEAIVLPSTIETIEGYAFRDCAKLSSINFPEGLISIGSYAFYEARAITTIILPKTLKTIESHAFAYKNNVDLVYIPKSVEFVGSYAFYGGFRNIYCEADSMPSNWAYNAISGEVIWSCNGVTSDDNFDYVIINNEVSVVKFKTDISEVIIPEYIEYGGQQYPITKLENYLFQNCYYIQRVVLPDSITYIGEAAFYDCRELVSINIPKNIKYIGTNAFTSCNIQNDIYLPSSLETVGSYAVQSYGKVFIAFESRPSGWDYDWKYNVNNIIWGCSGIIEIDGLKYFYKNDNTATLYGVIDDRSEMIISESINIDNQEYVVTSIYDHAFYDNDNLVQVVLPDTILEIGNYAFAYSNNLVEINIPKNIISIGDHAFYDCSITSHLFMPNTLEYIGSYAIWAPYIFIQFESAPSGWEEYCLYNEPYLVWGCSGISEIDGFKYYYKNDNTATLYGSTSGTSEIIIPEKIIVNNEEYPVTEIAEYAFFNETNIEKVIMPDTITYIGVEAFSNCYNLIELTLSSSLKHIASRAFQIGECYLEYLFIPDTVEIVEYQGLNIYTEIRCQASSKPSGWDESWTFNGNVIWDCLGKYEENGINYLIRNSCAEVISGESNEEIIIFDYIVYNGMEYPITKIQDYAFSSNICKTIKLPSSLQSIGNNAFSNCYNITSIELPNDIQSIGNYAFENCFGITEIDLPNSLVSIGENAFDSCNGLTKIEIPEKISTIESSTFRNCENLEEVVLPENLKNINSYAFYYCKKLETITQSTNLEYIGSYAFDGCYKLTEFHFDSVSYIGSKAFYNSGINDVFIPSNVVTIEENAFDSSATIYCEVSERPLLWHYNWTSSSNVTWGCAAIYDYEGLKYCLKDDTATVIRKITSDVEIYMPDSITYDNEYLVKYINDRIFYDTDIETIRLSNNLVSLTEYAFAYCENLKEIEIPAKITEIPYGTFMHCYGLTNVKLNNSLITIGNDAFSNCYNITSIDLPNSLVSIGENAFVGCSCLKSVNIPSSVTNIGNFAFAWTDLEEVIFEGEVPPICDSSVFEDVYYIVNFIVYIPKGSYDTYSSDEYLWQYLKSENRLIELSE